MSDSPRPYLSLVAPAFNEAEGIRVFMDACHEEVGKLNLPDSASWELIVVDDGSTDETAALVLKAAAAGAPVRLVQLSRNFGHQIAITAGIDVARGDLIATLDADLQHPPALLGQMLAALKDGADVVLMVKRSAGGRAVHKTLLSWLFYSTVARMSDVKIEAQVGDFRMITKEVADVLRSCRETHRFVRGLVAWAGFRQVRLEYDVAERAAGSPKYTLRKLWQLADAGLFSHSSFPLRWPLYLGLPLFAGAAGMILWALALFFNDRTQLPPGWLTLLVVGFLFSGLLFIVQGIQGIYIGKIFDQVKQRPLYVVSRPSADGASSETLTPSTPSAHEPGHDADA